MGKLEQIIQDYIKAEQERNVPIAGEYSQKSPKVFNDTYYHGYYNGYLTALFNINKLIIENKGEN